MTRRERKYRRQKQFDKILNKWGKEGKVGALVMADGSLIPVDSMEMKTIGGNVHPNPNYSARFQFVGNMVPMEDPTTSLQMFDRILEDQINGLLP